MVGLDLLATHPVYGSSRDLARLYHPALRSGPEDLVVTSRHYVEHFELTVLRGDPTLIRHLPATGSIERVLREHYVQLSVQRLLYSEHFSLNLLPLVADRSALYLLIPERRDEPFVTLQRPPRPLALVFHRT